MTGWEWAIFLMTKTWYALIAAIAATVGGVTIHEKVITPYMMRRKESKRLFEASNKRMEDRFGMIDKLATDIDFIKAELSPNSGKSMKDVLNKNATDLLMIGQNVKVMRYRQKFAFRVLDTPMFWCDIFGYATAVNNKLIELYGAESEEQMLGHGWANFIAHEDRDRALKEWNESVNHNKETKNYFHVVNGKTGEKYEVCYRAIFEREGDAIITVCGMVQRLIPE